MADADNILFSVSASYVAPTALKCKQSKSREAQTRRAYRRAVLEDEGLDSPQDRPRDGDTWLASTSYG